MTRLKSGILSSSLVQPFYWGLLLQWGRELSGRDMCLENAKKNAWLP